MQFILEQGYNNTGLNQVLEAAKVPKGSFYYYFDSKEDFGLKLVEEFEVSNKALLGQFLGDQAVDPLTRLRNYFQFNCDYLESLGCRQGCLVGNLGQEMSDQSETLRLSIKRVMDDWATSLSECVKEAQAAGQLTASLDAVSLGLFCLNNLQGAFLQMKITKNPQPLRLFMQFTFELVLKPS